MNTSSEHTNEIFEKQRREYNQSIKYASYIQEALFPDDCLLKSCFNEYFILFIPRDVVSGDFYWVSKKGEMIYIAVGDCTGHGVPGAFLSIMGISFLNQLVEKKGFKNISGILNALREHFMKALNQTGSETEQKDGIDMSFCAINTSKNELQYCGAFNPLYIIRNNNKLIEMPGDKMPIGIAAEYEASFTEHFIELHKGDMVYLFSDGFVDQFGGPMGKKFKYRPYRNLLLEINKQPVSQQKARLHEAFNNWKGNQNQLDDVLIFGFRYLH